MSIAATMTDEIAVLDATIDQLTLAYDDKAKECSYLREELGLRDALLMEISQSLNTGDLPSALHDRLDDIASTRPSAFDWDSPPSK